MIDPKGRSYDQRPLLRLYKLEVKGEVLYYSVINLENMSHEQAAAVAPLCGEIPTEVEENREKP